MKTYKIDVLSIEDKKQTIEIQSDSARGVKSKLRRMVKNNDIKKFFLPKRLKAIKKPKENDNENETDTEIDAKTDRFDVSSKENHNEMEEKKVEKLKSAESHDFRSQEEPYKEHNRERNEPKEETKLNQTTPFEESFKNDNTEEVDEPIKKAVKSGDSQVLSAIIPTFLTSLMAVVNSIIGKELFKNTAFSKEESKNIKNSFQEAFPDTKINPKLAFFGVIAIALGGRINIKELNDKNNEQ